jgi:hypothetical protein
MLRVKAVTDDDFKIEIEHAAEDGNPVHHVDFVTDLHLLYSSCVAPGDTLEQVYQKFQDKLSERLGKPVSKATAYLVAEAVCTRVGELKKTSMSLPALLSLASALPAVAAVI